MEQSLNFDIHDENLMTLEKYEELIIIEQQMKEMKYELLDILYDFTISFIKENMLYMSYENFDEILYKNISDMLFCTLENICNIDEETYEHIYMPELLIKRCLRLIYNKFIPPRSYNYTFIRNYNLDISLIEKKISENENKLQPAQRTKEWYDFRHQIITASNAWKMFDSQSVLNSLIYEKCQPINYDSKTPDFVNTETTLHWGQKYEPLSIILYEMEHNTKIGEYGCIRHNKYTFLGASPDGINIKKDNSRYGRMLEIKNIVNREITKIPKKEYWIQMQLQMEVCNLNECDFLETRFIEYENEEAYNNDGDKYTTSQEKQKGKILLFYNNSIPVYEYYVSTKDNDYEKWEEEIFKKNENNMFMRTIYWYADEISCILVLRNKLWFNEAIIKVADTWKIIEYERINGCEHRAPKKRIRKNSFSITENKCLISMNKTKNMDELENNDNMYEYDNN